MRLGDAASGGSSVPLPSSLLDSTTRSLRAVSIVVAALVIGAGGAAAMTASTVGSASPS
jgi:hypothetical protein